MDINWSDKIEYLNELAVKSTGDSGKREKRLVIGDSINYSNCRRLDMRAARLAGDNPLNNISHEHFGFDFYQFINNDSKGKDAYLIFDVGCGCGSVLNDITNRLFLENVFCFGIDKKLAGHELSDDFFIKGDATNLKALFKEKDRYKGIPCGWFDLIISTHVMHELEGYEAKDDFLSEVMRVLKPGGHAIITIPERYDIKPLIADSIYAVNGGNKRCKSLIFRK